ncbi:CBS domain-containing protein [Pelagibius marinus]|uniref:CBS domain-containing protein n=1 Tax=Pelagibius marinus TaxID=2762760 RepID=UPI0018728679|nr:CBS domain-containing protein [Pelagibius marinus]
MHRKVVPDIVDQQKIELLPSSTLVRAAARNMAERHIGAVLVGSGGRLEGIFTERDLLIRVVARGLDPDGTPLSAVMTADPDTVGPDDLASLALERMRTSGYRHVPVVEDGEVVGIVSLRDLYAAAKRELEEDLQQREAFIFDTGYGTG